MLRIFQYLKKYLPTVGIIIVLLLVQAFCDLSLPQYTSDIIDTGIQNKGVEHVLPEKIRIPICTAFYEIVGAKGFSKSV